jgi:hypothetical protein
VNPESASLAGMPQSKPVAVVAVVAVAVLASCMMLCVLVAGYKPKYLSNLQALSPFIAGTASKAPDLTNTTVPIDKRIKNVSLYGKK